MTAALDLASPLFWLSVVPAVLLLAVWTGDLRRWAQALVNLGFVLVVLGRPAALGALVVAGLGWAVARWLARGGRGPAPFWLACAAVLGAFVVHKLALPEVTWLSAPKQVLAGLGFSYVALRAMDLFRAVQEGHEQPPDLPQAINYLLPFHMLAAGPIQAYSEFVRDSEAPKAIGASGALGGFDRIATGLFKKFVLAQAIAEVGLTGFQSGGPWLLVELQLFYLWVFLDFSGYCDIAVGLGRLMGVSTPENFDRPLQARNLVEFWERWHISLSRWIRFHLFIPLQLGLTRARPDLHPLVPATVAFGVAFLLCGLWHGLTLRFLSWGLFHAVGLIACNLYRHALQARLGRKGIKRYLEIRPVRWAATALTFEFVAVSLALALAEEPW